MARKLSEANQVVQGILNHTKGRATYGDEEVQRKLKEAGIEISASQFNSYKNWWKQHHGGSTSNGKKKGSQQRQSQYDDDTPAVTLDESVAFVEECGGVKAARQRWLREGLMLKRFDKLLALGRSGDE